jgi:hypothetical protein
MKEDFLIIKNAVSPELCKFIALEFEMMETVCKQLYPNANLADLCDNTFARYSPLMMETLSVWVQPQVEKAVGMSLFPTYSYARIYYQGSELQKHVDRPSSEVTVSVCLEKDCDWPLYVKNSNGVTHCIDLEVGDIAIYSGRLHEHWRDPLPAKRQIQAFLQYVDAKGDDAWLKWDTRPCLGLPFEYTSQAVQNELKQISDVNDLMKRFNQRL